MTNPILRAADVLDANWLPEYQKQRDAIFRQLRDLNSMVFVLQKIEMFPFWLFTPIGDGYAFWYTIQIALMETSMMITSRVIVESGGQALSLKNFRHELLQNASGTQAKQEIVSRLKRVGFEKRIDAVEKAIRGIRNNFIAHLNKLHQMQDPSVTPVGSITYAEMDTVLEAAFELFNALTFESAYDRWPHQYRDQLRQSEQTDVDMLLRSIAKSSRLLNMPEQEPDIWMIRRTQLTANDLQRLNEYRKKAGLDEVS